VSININRVQSSTAFTSTELAWREDLESVHSKDDLEQGMRQVVMLVEHGRHGSGRGKLLHAASDKFSSDEHGRVSVRYDLAMAYLDGLFGSGSDKSDSADSDGDELDW
jgi:hypothetical protein